MPLAKPNPIQKDGQSSVAWSGKRALREGATPSSLAGLQCETAPAVSDIFILVNRLVIHFYIVFQSTLLVRVRVT